MLEFQTAVTNNEFSTIERLGEIGGASLINSADSKCRTPLHMAAARGHIEALKTLLVHGAMLDVKDNKGFNKGFTPFHLALEGENISVTRELIAEGADVQDLADLAPWRLGPHVIHLKQLIDNGSDVYPAQDGWCGILKAAYVGDSNAIRFLLSEGASVKSKLGNGTTSLHIAALQGNAEALDLFLSMHEGIAVDVEDTYGRTPLHHASNNCHHACSASLLAQGADVNAIGRSTGTPLHIAVEKARPACIVALLDAGADVNAIDPRGRAPLGLAYQVNVIKLLLAAGANKPDTALSSNQQQL